MSNNLGESSVITPAGNNVLREILRHRGPAKPHVLTLHNEGPAAILFGFSRRRDGAISEVIADEQTAKTGDTNAGYTGTGSQKVFTGGSLDATAIVPGTLTVNETTDSPPMQDPNGDGVLWQQWGARKQASTGTFAAMNNEVMTVSVDGGPAQTVTFGTEATITAAAAVITSQLEGAVGEAQGAQNVDITSELLGEGSSIEVLTVDAAITTKLGISAGLSTNLGGTIDYFSGALELSYQGYDPTNLEDITSDYTETPEIAGGSDCIMRVATIADDDEIILSAMAANAAPIVHADLRTMNRNTK